jgi:hypothetical protein
MGKRLHPGEFSVEVQSHLEDHRDAPGTLRGFTRHGMTVTIDLGERVADKFLEELSELTRRWYREVEGK